MTDVTNELMYEVLKEIQARLTHVEDNTRDLVKGQLRIRKDINELRGDIIRHDENFARLEVRLDRIEKRLELVDA